MIDKTLSGMTVIATPVAIVAMVLGCTLVNGCASTGVDRSAATVKSARALGDEFGALSTQIDKTLEALSAVSANREGNLRGAYDAYLTELGNLESQGEAVVSQSEDLRDNMQEYIAGWEEQMAKVKNPALREHADKRRAEASKKFEEAREELDRIRADYGKFTGHLKEIKTVLENDLNPSGVAALEPIMQAAVVDSGPVKDDIKKIMDALEKGAATFEAGTAESTRPGDEAPKGPAEKA